MRSVTFSDEVIYMIKSTSFGHFFDMPPCKVITTDLDGLISQYHSEGFFYIGERKLQFAVSDLQSILNIPNEGIDIEDIATAPRPIARSASTRLR